MPSRRKLAGFTEAAQRAGISIAPVEHALSRWRAASGHDADAAPGVTGIICASDVLALGAIRAARRAGLTVPGDVSVVGYDDSALLNCTDPPLTTVRQPIEPMGMSAVALTGGAVEPRTTSSGSKRRLLRVLASPFHLVDQQGDGGHAHRLDRLPDRGQRRVGAVQQG